MNARQTVTTIGWIWVGFGVLAFVAGAGGLIISTLSGLPASPLPVRSGLMDFIWEHYREGAAVQVVVALGILFTASMLLRRRSWARVAIQIFSALFLAWVVCFGVFWLRALGSMTSGSDAQQVPGVVRFIMSVGGIVAMGIIAFVFGLCMWTLSRAAVREEFRSDNHKA